MGFCGDLVSFVSVFLLVWVRAYASIKSHGHVRNYITWDDMMVDENKLSSKSSGNEGRVIVVDQYGRGHSRTVQGAVNMVLDDNSKRVKIYIYPGTYR